MLALLLQFKTTNKASGSDLLAKLTRAWKVAKLGGQSLEGNLVQQFLMMSMNMKLKERILELRRVDGKIQLSDLRERVKEYKRNLAITGVSKPQADASEKAESNQGVEQAVGPTVLQVGHAGFVDLRSTLRDNVPKTTNTATGQATGTRTVIHCLETNIRFQQIQIRVLGKTHL